MWVVYQRSRNRYVYDFDFDAEFVSWVGFKSAAKYFTDKQVEQVLALLEKQGIEVEKMEVKRRK